MKILYITEQGSIIKKTSRRLIISKERKTLAEISLIGLEGIVIFGNVQITSQAIASLLENGIYVSFLSQRGRYRGILLPNQHKNVFLRIAQYERYLNEEFQREFASTLVLAKIMNAKALILRYCRNYPEKDFSTFIFLIEQAIEKIKNKPPVPILLGIEGYSARAYFNAFKSMIRNDINFTGRNRKPPKDPVNALLSFGYAMITTEILSLLFANGFDPYIGYLHGIDYGRPALALDMVEEFRHSLIDRLVLSLLNNNIISSEDFLLDDDKGLILSQDALKKFIHHYEKRVTEPFLKFENQDKLSYRQLFKIQVNRLARTITSGQHYKAHVLE